MRSSATPGRSKLVSLRPRRILDASSITVARLAYAALTGGSLVIVTFVSEDRATVGTYVYELGAASAIAVGLSFGLDRANARRVAAFESAPGIPVAMRRTRIGQLVASVAVAVAITVLFDINLSVVLSVAIFSFSRVLYMDVECVWIASGQSNAKLAIALVTNGLLTAGFVIAGGVGGSAVVMIAGSASANLAGLFVLIFSVPSLIAGTTSAGIVRESMGFAGNSLLSVVYSRIDLAILAVVGTPLQAVAIYGVVSRAFDALLIVRGTVAQQTARSIAKFSEVERSDVALRRAISVEIASTAVTFVAGIVFLTVIQTGYWPASQPSDLICCALLAVPLFMSNFVTSAIAYADRRSHLLLLGSVVSCLFSVAVKAVLIGTLGVNGAVLSIGAVEFASMLVFVRLYGWGGGPKNFLVLAGLTSISAAVLSLLLLAG